MSIITSYSSEAQADNDKCIEITNKKAIKMYQQALDLLQSRNREEGYKLLIDVIREEPEFADAYMKLAEINYSRAKSAENPDDINRYMNRAIDYFSKTIEYCPSLNDYDACFQLGSYYFDHREFNKAMQPLSMFVNNTKAHPGKSEAKSMLGHIKSYNELKSKPVPFNPQKLIGLNTDEDEFLPLISPDGELAFFTHRYPKKTGEVPTIRWVDEFSVSKKQGINGSIERFSAGEAMPTPFNQSQDIDQGAVSITIDNNHMYVTLCQFAQGHYKNCDIFVSDFKNGEWGPLRNMGIAINGKNSWESQPSISADGKILFFSSIRPDNIGFDMENQTCDIWMSKMDDKGVWQKAVNLGTTINTPGNEKSPFMHSDSQTLYFASDGRNGLGGYDIYYSKMKPDGTWTEPKNIGYPINTEADDLGFIVSTNGQKAYFSSNKLNESGGWDIYSFDLYEEARPEEVFFAKGQLHDDEGNVITEAKVELKNVSTNKVTEAMVDETTGNYAVAVAVDNNDEFLMTVKKKDYAFTSEYIKPKEAKLVNEPIKIDFEVKPVEIGKKVKINNIYFSSNSSIFEQSSRIVLDNFLEFLEENPKIKIEIHGHTDNVGDEKSNQQLSEQRAKAVRDYLVLMGLDQDRVIAYKGFGESMPVATNDTPEGRAKNRRTEFVIVDK